MTTTGLTAGTLAWAEPGTWAPPLATWLRPMLRRGAPDRLRARDTSGLYDDGSEWLDLLGLELRQGLDATANALAADLTGARLRTFHGCRTKDAGEYLRHGLRAHRREELAARLRKLVAGNPRYAHLLPGLEGMMAGIESGIDEGRCHVVLDERALLRDAAHYLIYGSEWMCAVVDGGTRGPLSEEGAPTVLAIELPLRLASAPQRRELATELLRGWTQQAAGMRRVPVIDFTFSLRADLEPAHVVGHRHPGLLRDPLNGDRAYRPTITRCRACPSA